MRPLKIERRERTEGNKVYFETRSGRCNMDYFMDGIEIVEEWTEWVTLSIVTYPEPEIKQGFWSWLKGKLLG